MKKTMAAAAVALAGLVGLAAPAHADTVALPYGGTATLTVPDAILIPGGGCINHYGNFTITHTDYWNVDLTAHGPSTWPATEYLYGTGPTSRIVDLQLCPTFDGPGLYTVSGLVTVEDPYSYNQREVLISDQFTISNPAPAPAPVPAPLPAPAPPTTADVIGTVSSKGVTNGVTLAFKSAALPIGTVVGTRLSWTVLVDGKIRKSFSQGPSAVRNLKVTSRDRTGRHVVKILRNGKSFKTFRYRA